jgi:hypothetical protein
MNRLYHMIRIMGIKKQVLEEMSTLCDFSYAWVAMGRYLKNLQDVISENP